MVPFGPTLGLPIVQLVLTFPPMVPLAPMSIDCRKTSRVLWFMVSMATNGSVVLAGDVCVGVGVGGATGSEVTWIQNRQTSSAEYSCCTLSIKNVGNVGIPITNFRFKR